jgi:GNAT superfamily N-acetyltransferase
LPDGFALRDMDMDSGADIDAWLDVHNTAFGHAWTRDDFQRIMLEHPVVRVDRTFLIERGREAVAVASAGVFRRNQAVGAGHYLGVKPGLQGLGLGKAVVTRRVSWFAESGFASAESQTHISREPALRLHYDLGFHPKYRFDPWNSVDPVSWPVRRLVNARLRSVYRRWQREQASRAART